MDISTSKLEGISYVAVPPEESLNKKFRGAVYMLRTNFVGLFTPHPVQ